MDQQICQSCSMAMSGAEQMGKDQARAELEAVLSGLKRWKK